MTNPLLAYTGISANDWSGRGGHKIKGEEIDESETHYELLWSSCLPRGTLYFETLLLLVNGVIRQSRPHRALHVR